MGKLGKILVGLVWAFGGAFMTVVGFRIVEQGTDYVTDQFTADPTKKGNDVLDDPTSID